MKKKKVIFILIISILLLGAGISIYLGIYYTKLTKPSNLVGISIDQVDSKLVNYLKLDDKYNLDDSFSIEANIDFDLDSEDYLNKSKKDKEYLEKYNTLKNLSGTTNTISINQNKDEKKSLIEVNSVLNKESIVNYKYLIENATSYYYVDDILKNFVNAGTSNYYEMFVDENTTLDNIHYVHDAFLTAFKNNIKDEYFEKYKVTTNINGSKEEVNQISIRVDDKLLHKILNGTIDDLKKDERANKILTSANKDFAKYKIKDKTTLLGKKENYTLNIYSSKYLNNVLKYEVIHLNGDEKTTYTYEGNASKGNLYYIEDDTVVYSMKISDNDKVLECKIDDSAGKEIGVLKVEKSEVGTYYTFNFDDGTKKYDVIYSSKYDSVKDNKEFVNDKELSFKYIENKVSVLSGNIKLNIKANTDAKIDEDVSNAVLESTLTEEQKSNYDNKLDSIRERLKK